VANRRPRLSRLSEGLPYPLGAAWDGLGVNFALFTYVRVESGKRSNWPELAKASGGPPRSTHWSE